MSIHDVQRNVNPLVIQENSENGHCYSRSAAALYQQHNMLFVPMARGTKAPKSNGWQHKQFGVSEVDCDGNIGIKTGYGLIDIDLDVPEAIQVADLMLPETGLIGGHTGSPRSHRFYHASNEKTLQYKDADGVMLIELRARGGQTVVYPSIHPDGDQYQWYGNGEPATLESGELLVSRVAAAALLARLWPDVEGGRHEFALAAAGFLVNGGLDGDVVMQVIEIAATVAGDNEVPDRVKAAETTIARGVGANKGVTELKDAGVTQGNLNQLNKWLMLQTKTSVAQPEDREALYEKSAVSLVGLEVEPVKWLVYPYFALGVLTGIEGNGGLGKTLTMFDVIARLTTGTDFPTNMGLTRYVKEPMGAVIITAEEGIEQFILPRLLDAGADINRVRIIDKVYDGNGAHVFDFMSEYDRGALRYAVKKVNAGLVFVDPITEMMGDANVNSAVEVRRALGFYQDLADELHFCPTFTRHNRKSNEGGFSDKGAGSKAFYDRARSVLSFSQSTKDGATEQESIITHSKSNYAPKQKPVEIKTEAGAHKLGKMEWVGLSSMSNAEVLASLKAASSPQGQGTGYVRREFQDIQLYIETVGETTIERLYELYPEEDTNTVKQWCKRMVDRGMIARVRPGIYNRVGLQGVTV